MTMPPSDPFYAKRRLPFPEHISLAQSGGKRIGLFLLLIAALLCAAATYYSLVVRGLALGTPEVLTPGFGCFYFCVRFFLAMRPRLHS
jgi:hypothetical protein